MSTTTDDQRARAGRPQVAINWDTVGKLLMAGCKTVDIAGQLGVSRMTLYRRCKSELGVNFVTFCQQKAMSGENLLRAKQYDVAMTGNPTMLIWLGKQMLGQTDKAEVSGTGGGPVKIVVEYVNGKRQATDATPTSG